MKSRENLKYWMKVYKKGTNFLMTEQLYLMVSAMLIFLFIPNLYSCLLDIYVTLWKGEKEFDFHMLVIDQSCISLYGAMLLSRANFYEFYNVTDDHMGKHYETILAESGMMLLVIPVVFNIMIILLKEWAKKSQQYGSWVIGIHNGFCVFYMLFIILIISQLSFFMIEHKYLKDKKHQ